MIAHTIAKRAIIFLIVLFTLYSGLAVAQQSGAKKLPPLATMRSQAPSDPQLTPVPEPLTVEDAVRIGTARNPQVTAAVAGVASAAANYRSIAAIPDPQLGITHAQGTSTAPTLNGTNTDTFIDLGEVVDTSGQRRFQAAGAKAQYASAQYQLIETKLTWSSRFVTPTGLLPLQML
jgi:outer membrane protein TolC